MLGDNWDNVGVTVTISILNGEELAKQTFNGRLGILGGLSILGTTGIVEPYSNSAFKVSILKAIRVARSNGCDHLVLTPGGRSETFAQRVFHCQRVIHRSWWFSQTSDGLLSAQSPAAGHLRRFCGQVFESCCWTVRDPQRRGAR